MVYSLKLARFHVLSQNTSVFIYSSLLGSLSNVCCSLPHSLFHQRWNLIPVPPLLATQQLTMYVLIITCMCIFFLGITCKCPPHQPVTHCLQYFQCYADDTLVRQLHSLRSLHLFWISCLQAFVTIPTFPFFLNLKIMMVTKRSH